MIERLAKMADELRYAGFWIRVGANVLDLLALAAVNIAAALFFDSWESSLPPGVGSVSGPPPLVTLFTLVFPPIAIVGSWMALGASPGKIVLGLRIVDEPTGGRLSLPQSAGRYVVAILGVLCAGAGIFWIAIDRRHQGWHDKIVRTLVVRR